MAQRILIISSQKLIGQAIGAVLIRAGFQVQGPLAPNDEALSQAHRLGSRAVVVVEGDDAAGKVPFTSRVLQQEADVPVIRVGLEGDRIFVYEAHQVPARAADLVAAIRKLPERKRPAVTDS